MLTPVVRTEIFIFVSPHSCTRETCQLDNRKTILNGNNTGQLEEEKLLNYTQEKIFFILFSFSGKSPIYVLEKSLACAKAEKAVKKALTFVINCHLSFRRY